MTTGSYCNYYRSTVVVGSEGYKVLYTAKHSREKSLQFLQIFSLTTKVLPCICFAC